MKRLILTFIMVGTIGIVGYLIYISNKNSPQPSAQVVAIGTASVGFELVTEPMLIEFPDAFNAQPQYQTEWWYYTGNLETSQGRHFGYQLTFFRRGLIAPEWEVTRESDWASGQVYFAHFTISDITQNKFYYFENIGRGAVGIAGAQINPFRVWIEDWVVEETGEDAYRLHAKQNNLAVDLMLEDLKGPILHGEGGFMPSGPNRGDASYYYSQTRLASIGTLNINEQQYEVSGLSWMDRQYGTTAILTPEQGGWNWFAFHLDNGSELMLYELRNKDGSANSFSRGTYIDSAGNTTDLSFDAFHVTVESMWRSSHTKIEYPSGWTINVPALKLTLSARPYMADQELVVSQHYWEGAVEVTGSQNNSDVAGSGYIELTGYAP